MYWRYSSKVVAPMRWISAARQGGLEHVAGVEASLSRRPRPRWVDLVDEGSRPGCSPARSSPPSCAPRTGRGIWCTSHQTGDIQRHDALVEEHAAHFALDDTQGETFGDGVWPTPGSLMSTGLFFLRREDKTHALDSLLATDDGIQLAVLGQLGERSRPKLSSTGVLLLLSPPCFFWPPPPLPL